MLQAQHKLAACRSHHARFAACYRQLTAKMCQGITFGHRSRQDGDMARLLVPCTDLLTRLKRIQESRGTNRYYKTSGRWQPPRSRSTLSAGSLFLPPSGGKKDIFVSSVVDHIETSARVGENLKGCQMRGSCFSKDNLFVLKTLAICNYT